MEHKKESPILLHQAEWGTFYMAAAWHTVGSFVRWIAADDLGRPAAPSGEPVV